MNVNEEPYAGKPQVRFCEGNKSSHNILLGENYMTTRQTILADELQVMRDLSDGDFDG